MPERGIAEGRASGGLCKAKRSVSLSDSQRSIIHHPLEKGACWRRGGRTTQDSWLRFGVCWRIRQE